MAPSCCLWLNGIGCSGAGGRTARPGGWNSDQQPPHRFPVRICPARYSDSPHGQRQNRHGRILPAAGHEALPSTTNRFLMSWLWFHLFSTLVFGLSPMRHVPISWMLYPGGWYRSCLGEDFIAGAWHSSSSRIHRVLRHVEFVVGVLVLDVQHGNAPRILHVLVDADVVLIARQHFAHDGQRDAAAARSCSASFQVPRRRPESTWRSGAAAAAESSGIAANEILFSS